MSAAETSRDAYHAIETELGRKQKAILSFIVKYGPINNRELSERIGWPINQITPRVLELRERGLVVSAGKDVDPVTGFTAEDWQARS